MEVNFVFVSGQPKDLARKRKVRSHAARNVTARRQRVIEYQSEQSRPHEAAHTECQEASEPLGCLIPLNPQTILGAGRNDPFQSFARPTSPFENFLLDHFVQQIVLTSVTRLCIQGAEFENTFRFSLAQEWVQLAAGDPGILSGLLMAACRNLSINHHAEIYGSQLLAYKYDCIRILRLAMESEGSRVSDSTIVKTLALASDALTTHDTEASLSHFRAAQLMIRLRGEMDCVAHAVSGRKMAIWYIRGSISEPNTILNPCDLPLPFKN